MNKKILVTGGAGFIGSHTCVELLNRGYDVVVVDNLVNSCEESMNRVSQITGRTLTFVNADVRNFDAIDSIFKAHAIDSVIHFAGLKAVGESVAKPLMYYDNNIYGTIVLLDAMTKNNVKKIVFSSSATVYGDPEKLPIDENSPLSTTNPYGSTKLMLEGILKDVYRADNEWNIVLLRYFNPIGAHASGLIGENPQGIPNNLLPYVAQVASGRRKELQVFGDDYPTIDGTGVRDYIHVVDLAIGHIKAIENINEKGVHVFNLGTGIGYSVLEIAKAFEKASGKAVPYKICPRRPGDIATCYAKVDKARDVLGWTANFGIDEMCSSLWKWQSMNPDGFTKS